MISLDYMDTSGKFSKKCKQCQIDVAAVKLKLFWIHLLCCNPFTLSKNIQKEARLQYQFIIECL